MKFSTLLILLAILGALAYFLQPVLFPNQAAPFSLQSVPASRAAAFSASYAGDFLSYADPTLGYSVAYPLGYVATDYPNVSSVLFSVIRAQGPSEHILVQAAPDLALADFQSDAKGAYANGHNETASTTVSGVPVTIYSGVVRNDLTASDEFLINAYYACPAQGYNAVLSAVVPEDLALDSEAVNYMIHSFRCSSA